MVKKFLCDLSVKKDKLVTNDCKPCYNELEKYNYNYIQIVTMKDSGYTQLWAPVVKEADSAHLVLIFNENWKYIAEALIIDDEVIVKNIGGGGNSPSQLDELIDYLEDNNVWNNILGCSSAAHYDEL